ncbi:kinase-like protein, partial [Trichoderma citrinoviride]
ASAASTVSWNTFLSRTNVSSLASAVFSEQENHPLHGLDDVIRAVTALGLRRYRYEEIAREEKVGEGETYIVERCVVANQVLAVKHLKTDSAMDDQTSHRRLRAVILELQVLRHQPLRNHPNFPYVFGYGWNMNDEQVMPYLLVQYAPEGTLRQYIKSMASPIPRRDLHILAGDVASALCALHKCGIVHGDVKLDNVLVVHSWDRPAQALAKLTDFGHALIINDKFNKQGGIMRYRGT